MSCPVGMLLVSAVRVAPTLRSPAGRAAAVRARWFCDYETRSTVRVPQTPWNA